MPTATDGGDAPATAPPREPIWKRLTRRPPAKEHGRPRIRLATRLAASTAALLAASLGLSLAFATWRADVVTSRKIEENLRLVPAIHAGFESAEAAALRQQVRSLAEQPGTKALLAEASVDPATFHDSTRELARDLGAGVVFFFDSRGALIARGDRAPGEEAGRDFSGVRWVQEPLTHHADTWAYILDVTKTRTLYLVASAPVVQGEGRDLHLIGVVAAAFAVDDRRAAAIGRLLSADAAFVANFAPRGARPETAVVASTPGLKEVAFHERLAAAGLLAPLFLEGRRAERLELSTAAGGHIATALPVLSGSGEPIAALVIARSKAAELAVFHEIRRGLLWITALVLLASLPVSIGLARHVSRPIERLAEAARAIRTGQIEGALPPLPKPGSDEVGVLSLAFSEMVDELKEKAALEQWVSEILRRPGDVTQGGRELPGAPSAFPEGLAPGKLFARRYLVLSILGQGGMGTVFRVHDKELEEDVALKVLLPEAFREGPEAVQALKQEIRLARAITHPNVVRVHDLGESDGVRFLTMEYVAGTTLAELLEKLGPLDVAPGVQIAKQICRGLSAVHKAGVVHGDLKPRNIMVMANAVVKLMDFGVAQGLRSDARTEGAGSPHYMSPEQIRGGELDARCDVYAAGVTLYEMFTGRRPFDAETPEAVLKRHLHESPLPPRRWRSAMPELLEGAILGCLEKSRVQRTASAADLERTLLRVHV